MTITDEDGTLVGQTTAVTAATGQAVQPGRPKPDGSLPGETTEVTGTYDAESGAYTLDWALQPDRRRLRFDGFTGVWHLEGHLRGQLTPPSAPPVHDPGPFLGVVARPLWPADC